MITPSEIFKDPVIRQSDEVQYWGYDTPLDDMLASLERLTGHNTLLDVDEIGTGLNSLTYYAATVLGKVPPRTVFEYYGDEGLIFMACHASSLEVENRFQDALMELCGYDKGLFDKATLWAYQKYHTSGCREALAQYAVMETVTGGWLDSVDISAVLKDCVLPGVIVGDERLQHYELLPLCSQDSQYEPAGWERNWACDIEPEPGQKGEPIVRYSVWLDAPTGFALGYKGCPQALVALECVGQRELMISQLQGVQAKRIDPEKRYSKDAVIGRIGARGLAPFDWQKVMVAVAEELAMHLGLGSLAIQGGENNVWRKKRLQGETEPHITAEVATRAYDVPAERLGFVRLNDCNWHRSVPRKTPKK